MTVKIAKNKKFISFCKGEELIAIWNATDSKNPMKCTCYGTPCKEISNPLPKTLEFSNIKTFLYCETCKRYFFILKEDE